MKVTACYNVKVTVCYITVTHGPKTADYAARFVESWHRNPPGSDCELIVVCNGGPLAHSIGLIFSPLKAKFFPRRNDGGYDISGYIDVAWGPARNSDWLLCLGESVHFHRQGWLKHITDCVNYNGEGLYGFLSSFVIRAHLQTSAFATTPRLLREYPYPVTNKASRYEFEHGQLSFWRWLRSKGTPSWLVTWDGCWAPKDWRKPENILWRGDQSNCLVHCNHTLRYEEAEPARKASWRRSIDRPFQ